MNTPQASSLNLSVPDLARRLQHELLDGHVIQIGSHRYVWRDQGERLPDLGALAFEALEEGVFKQVQGVHEGHTQDKWIRWVSLGEFGSVLRKELQELPEKDRAAIQADLAFQKVMSGKHRRVSPT